MCRTLTKKEIKKLSEVSTGTKNSNWHGGKRIAKEYIYIYMPNHPNARKNYVLEHRLVVEKKIGRYLKKGEVVHHINENKKDNRIENLMLFPTTGAHMAFHCKVRQFGMTNPIKRQIANRWKKIKEV